MVTGRETDWFDRFNFLCVLRRLSWITEQLDEPSRERLLTPLERILDYLDLAAGTLHTDPQSTPWWSAWRQGLGSKLAALPLQDGAVAETNARQELRAAFVALSADPQGIEVLRRAARRYLAVVRRTHRDRPAPSRIRRSPQSAAPESSFEAGRQDRLLQDILHDSRIGTAAPSIERSKMTKLIAWPHSVHNLG